MSAQALSAVGVVTERLQGLVSESRNLKQSSSIVPPLPTGDLELKASNINSLNGSQPNGDGAQLAQQAGKVSQAVFEAAARSIFYDMISQYSIDDEDFVNVWNLLDVLQLCADLEQCDVSLPLYLLEELLDSQTIDGCMKVFSYLESRRERLVANLNQNKKLILLRSCNELLRRLSRAEDAVFCGRVFIFLFQSFPLGDKSAVNLRGEFHTENTTVYQLPVEHEDEDGTGDETEQVEAELGTDHADPMEVDAKAQQVEAKAADDAAIEPEKAVAAKTPKPAHDHPNIANADSKSKKADASKTSAEQNTVLGTRELYPVFWQLQHAFSNPTSLFNPDDLKTFKIGIEATLGKFKSMPKVLQSPHQGIGQLTKSSSVESEAHRGVKRRSDGTEVETNAFSVNFTPKYLTSYDLFELELSDLTFQRSILVQSLVVLDFLLSLTPSAKAKSTSALTAAPNKAVLYSYTLSPADEAWTSKTRRAIADYLSDQQDGKPFYRMVQSVLTRDKNWAAWKASNCPPISLPPTTTVSEMEARKGAAQATEWKRLKVPPMSSIDLSFVTDEPDREQLNEQMRWERPEQEIGSNGQVIEPDDARMMKWLRRIDEIDLDMEMETDAAARRTLFNSRATASWRILRVLGTKDLVLFSKIGLIPDVGEDFTELKKLFEKKYDVPIGEEVDVAADVEMAGQADEAAEGAVEGGDEHVPELDRDAANDLQHGQETNGEPTQRETQSSVELAEVVGAPAGEAIEHQDDTPLGREQQHEPQPLADNKDGSAQVAAADTTAIGDEPADE